MESKRQSQQEEDIRGDQKRSERQDSQLSETCRIIGSFRYLLLIWNEMMPYLADAVRNLVREELERHLVPRPISTQTEISGARRCLKLVFRNELPDTIHTFSKIKDRDNNPLEVVLLDIESRSIVSDEDDPLLSSIKVEICVFDGEFGSDGSENWSNDEFNSKILHQRDHRGQLLKGDTVFVLKNGVGFIHNVSFTDNSSWIRTRCFRLGVKVAKSNLNDAVNIREGISKPFTVKDYRVNKRQNPSLNDEIWHLKNISKKGKTYEQLSKNGIYTVEDLLKEHETNPSSLQEKLGKICKISKRKQEEIIKQAKKAKHAKTGAETIFDGQNYQSENNTLNSDQTQACKSLRGLVQIEMIKHGLEKTLIQATNNGAPDQDVQQLDFPIAQREGISWLMDPENWSAENFVDGNIGGFVDVLSYNDEFGSRSTPPDINRLSFSYENEAAPTNHHNHHSSLPNCALNTSNKGKSKIV